MITGIFSLVPMDNAGPEMFLYQDKIWHFLTYAILSWLIFKVISGNQLFVYAIIMAALLSSLYGVFMEVLQALVNTGRYFDYFDIIANIIGSLTGSLVYYFTRKK